MAEARVDLTESALKALVERLATDDEFREQLCAEPAETLEEYGIHLSANEVPARISLPPKAHFAALLQQLDRPGFISSVYLAVAGAAPAAFAQPQPAVYGPGTVYGAAQMQPAVYGPGTVYGAAQMQPAVYGPATVYGAAQMQPAVYGPGTVYGAAQLQPAVYGPAAVYGAGQLQPAVYGPGAVYGAGQLQPAVYGPGPVYGAGQAPANPGPAAPAAGAPAEATPKPEPEPEPHGGATGGKAARRKKPR